MLFKKYSFFLVLLIVALCFNYVTAAKKKLTPEQQKLKNKLRAERKKKSEAADKLIRHTSAEDFDKIVLNDDKHLWIVFYGSKKCPHTQKFNPKWLQFQQNMDNGLYDFDEIKITKIECLGKQLDFCVGQDNQYWPELMFYYKGVKKAAYDGEDEIEDIVKYIKDNKDKFMNAGEKKTKTVPEKSNLPPKKASNQESAKKPPKTTPQAKRPPPTVKQTKQPPNVEENIENGIEDDVENNIDEENDENGIDENEDNNNENYNNYEDYNYKNYKQPVNTETETTENTSSSHVGLYSVGGVAACALCFIFAKKRFRGRGYSRVSGNDRPQTRYKYNKHIV